MLPTRILNFCVASSLALLSACVWSDSDPCEFTQFRDDIERTRDFIEYEAPMVRNNGALMGPVQRSCVVVSFNISESGEAKDARVEASYPNARLERSSLLTLDNYRFKAPDKNLMGDDGQRFFLYFEKTRNK